MLQLRCGACGAPYAGPANGELLTCGYCGTTQRMVDARQFLDHFMAQVAAFVQQAVPAGLDISHSETIDPVARLAAFNMGVRPRLSTESEQYRFSCFNLLSSPLAVLPFSPNPAPARVADPTTVSMFAAKVHYVSGLAVDEPSRELIRRSGGLATCYQSLLVAGRLSSGNQPERFHLISQNYSSAAKSIESTGRWAPIAARLEALAEECRAVDLYLTGQGLGEVRRLLGGAGEQLNRVRQELAATPDIGYMTTAVDQELAAIRVVGSMVVVSETSPTVAPHPLSFSQRLSGVLDWLGQSTPSDWAPSYRTMRLREEVFRRAAELRAAQAGGGSIRVAGGSQGCLVPFWVVELPYTFETGVAWSRHGKEVSEFLLTVATFPTDPSSLNGSGTAQFLTHVFGAAGGGGSFGRYIDHVRGREQRISEGGGLMPILQNVVPTAVPGAQAIPPLTTEAEALKLVGMYVDEVRSTNPKVAAQLRGSSPRILDLIYLPCNLAASPPVPWLGTLSPESLGDPRVLWGFLA